jgi:hypothetical protein
MQILVGSNSGVAIDATVEKRSLMSHGYRMPEHRGGRHAEAEIGAVGESSGAPVFVAVQKKNRALGEFSESLNPGRPQAGARKGLVHTLLLPSSPFGAVRDRRIRVPRRRPFHKVRSRPFGHHGTSMGWARIVARHSVGGCGRVSPSPV